MTDQPDSDECPIQVVFGPDHIESCTFPRNHPPPHSWAVPGVYEVPAAPAGEVTP